jgi:hypothetical protein
MRVALRVHGAAGAVLEAGDHQTVRVNLCHSASPCAGERGVLLQVRDRLAHRGGVDLIEDLGDLRFGHRPQDRERLRGRDRQVPAHDFVEPVLHVVTPTEHVAGERMASVIAFEEQFDVLSSHLAVEALGRGASAVPSAGRFTGAGHVVLDAGRDGVGVVARVAAADLAPAQHGLTTGRQRWSAGR